MVGWMAAHGIDAVPEGPQRCLQSFAPNERTIQTELPPDVREEPELRRSEPARAQALRHSTLALDECVSRVEPPIGLQVMLDSRKNRRDLRGSVMALDRSRGGPDAAIDHAPEVGKHCANSSDLRSKVAGSEESMKKKIHDA
jgi:hypothetical protein